MKNRDNKLKIVLIFILSAFFSNFFHEFGHWIVGEILGNDMLISINQVRPKSGEYIGNTELFVLCGGPIFTIILSITFLCLIEKYKILYFYPVIFYEFFSRLLTQILKFDLQDEAKVSALLGVEGIGKYAIAIIVLIILFLTTWRTSYVLKRNYKDNLFYCVVCIICLFLVVVLDLIVYLLFIK